MANVGHAGGPLYRSSSWRRGPAFLATLCKINLKLSRYYHSSSIFSHQKSAAFPEKEKEESDRESANFAICERKID